MEDWIAFVMGFGLGCLLMIPYANFIKSIMKKMGKALFKEDS